MTGVCPNLNLHPHRKHAIAMSAHGWHVSDDGRSIDLPRLQFVSMKTQRRFFLAHMLGSRFDYGLTPPRSVLMTGRIVTRAIVNRAGEVYWLAC